jgi:hypothetical protein
MAWIAILMPAVAMLAFALRWPWGPVVAGVAVTALAVAWKGLRDRLRCPLCDKRMTLPLKELAGWSSPPRSPWDHAWSTMYCVEHDIGLRTDTRLWGDPVCEVVNTWM